jgi:putative transcriptional regulator
MNNLKTLREQNNIKQYELANLLGISKDYLSMIERGKRTPGFKLAKTIADCFLVKVDDLNFFNDTKNDLYDESA